MGWRATIRLSGYPPPAQGAGPAPLFANDLDAALIRQAEEGNTVAFERIAARYDLVILRLLLVLTASERVAVELCSRTFVRAYRELKHRQTLSIYNWLYRIAAGEWLTWSNHHHPQWAGEDASAPEGAATSGTGLEQLSARERIVFVLKTQHLRLHTVAEILQTSDEAVARTFTRAIHKLRLATRQTR